MKDFEYLEVKRSVRLNPKATELDNWMPLSEPNAYVIDYILDSKMKPVKILTDLLIDNRIDLIIYLAGKLLEMRKEST